MTLLVNQLIEGKKTITFQTTSVTWHFYHSPKTLNVFSSWQWKFFHPVMRSLNLLTFSIHSSPNIYTYIQLKLLFAKPVTGQNSEKCHSSQEWYTACRKGQRRHAAWWHRLKEDVGRWHGLERVMEILSSLFLPFFLPNSFSSRQVSGCC